MFLQKLKKPLLFIFVGATTLGCTSHPVASEDPYEKTNRYIFAFNMDLDHLIYRPVATVYDTITPPPLRKGIRNIFANVAVITTLPNDILQLKFHYALLDISRLMINATLGIGGLFDVATRVGLPKHYEDFGMTFAYYSDTKRSPYLMAPFFGPYTFRDGFGALFDAAASPYPYLRPAAFSYSMYALKWTSSRADYLSANVLIDNAFDPYVFMRSSYLQYRAHLIENNQHDYVRGQKTEQNTLKEALQSSSSEPQYDLDYDFSINEATHKTSDKNSKLSK